MARRAHSVLSSAAWRQLVLASSLLLAGCGSPFLQPSSAPQPTHSYVLEWHGSAPPSAPAPRRDSLLVSPMLAAPGFDSSDMAYMRTAHEIEYFAHHRWVDAPARMLDPLLVKAAEQSGVFRNVVESGRGAGADLRLDSKLIHLQQVRQPNPGRLQLAVRLTLTEVASARVIATRTLSVTEAIHTQTPYAGVEAANRAVARLLSEVQGFLVDQVR